MIQLPTGTLRRFAEKALLHEGHDCLIWPFKLRHGYGYLAVGQKMYVASSFVCEKAHGNRPTPAHHAAHSCGHAACVNPRHISWKTPAENNADKVAHGTDNRGEKHYRAKLTAKAVLEIWALHGTMTQEKIAERYGVTRGAVSRVICGGTWLSVSPAAIDAVKGEGEKG